jgi:hypothetical protein
MIAGIAAGLASSAPDARGGETTGQILVKYWSSEGAEEQKLEYSKF